MGYYYRPKLKSGKPSRFHWMKYYVAGKPIKESTKSESEQEGRRLLKEREGRVAQGQPILPASIGSGYEEARGDLERHYQATG